MNLITQTYDADKWQLVPKVATNAMFEAILERAPTGDDDNPEWLLMDFRNDYVAMLAAAPEPVIMPEYPWDLFDDEIQWMAISELGTLVCATENLERNSGGWSGRYYHYIKFNRGNVDWKDSQMERPKK